MVWINPETGVEYQFYKGGWRIVSDSDNNRLVFKGVWELTSKNPGKEPDEGEWNVNDKREWNNDDDIYLNIKDKSGESHIYGNVSVGDIMEIKEDANNYCKYEVKKVKEEDDHGIEYLEVRIESVIEFKGEPHVGADAIITMITPITPDVPTLESVLSEGNIADKDIVLTDGVDDLIDISPTEGRIIIASDADLKTPKITLAKFGDND